MLTRKICMIGDFAVGKTSLTSRFVHSVFSEKYMTTVGVKIDTKEVKLPQGEQVKLVIWDIAGTSAISSVEKRYLRGAAGYLLVVDGTRRSTLESALELDKTAQELTRNAPRVMIFNKSDLKALWEIESDEVDQIGQNIPVRLCSALDGSGVEDAFMDIAHSLVASSNE